MPIVSVYLAKSKLLSKPKPKPVCDDTMSPKQWRIIEMTKIQVVFVAKSHQISCDIYYYDDDFLSLWCDYSSGALFFSLKQIKRRHPPQENGNDIARRSIDLCQTHREKWQWTNFNFTCKFAAHKHLLPEHFTRAIDVWLFCCFSRHYACHGNLYIGHKFFRTKRQRERQRWNI